MQLGGIPGSGEGKGCRLGAEGGADLQAIPKHLRGEQVVGNHQGIDGALYFTLCQ